MENNQNVLMVEGLSISFTQYDRAFKKISLPMIRDLNVSIHEKEIVAVVGSSGSGKSLLAHSILGILPYNAKVHGKMVYCGEPLTPEKKKALRGKELVLVPQSVNYMDPLMKIGRQVSGSRKNKGAWQKMQHIFSLYALPQDTAEKYPFQLSGGMARRVLISTAVMDHPKLVIADEPTPGLHLDAAKKVMAHFRETADQGAGVLLITHDLELALETADRIVVFYAGATLEEAPVADFKQEETLRHPYTKALWRAMPKNGFMPTAGVQPYVKDLPQGCPFRPRCEIAEQRCLGDIPYIKQGGGFVRCIKYQAGGLA